MAKKKFLLMMLIILVFSGCSWFANNDKNIKIVLMTTSDLQSTIVAKKYSVHDSVFYAGGLDRIAYEKKKVEKEADGVVLVSTGDDLFGNVYSFFHGEAEMIGMKMAGYDIITPGNHEFDYGLQQYEDALKYCDCEVISSNIDFLTNQFLNKRIKKYVIKEVAGIKIGFFGLMTPLLFLESNIKKDNLKLQTNIIQVANEMVNKLKNEKCDLIVALTHIGHEMDKELANNVQGIDIIIGGHSHQYIYEKINNTIIVQDGTCGKYVGELALYFQGKRLIKNNWKRVLMSKDQPFVQEIYDKMHEFQNRVDKKLETVIAQTDTLLDGRNIILRGRESNLGNLVADSWLDWFRDADVALVNSGAIRGNSIIPKGDLTYKDIENILPFHNELVKVKLTGEQLKQVLEIGASKLRPLDDNSYIGDGSFLQVAGIKFTIDTSERPFQGIYKNRMLSELIYAGDRVKNIYIYSNGKWQLLDKNKKYIVVINLWMFGGGNGYYIFLDNTIKGYHTTLIAANVLSAYLLKKKEVFPRIEGRIIIK